MLAQRLICLVFFAAVACSKDKNKDDPTEGASKNASCASVEECQKGCDKDKVDDCIALGDLLLDKPKKEKDDAATKKAYEAACDGGSQQGCVMAAMMLRRTSSKLADATKAAKVYEKAIRAWHVFTVTGRPKWPRAGRPNWPPFRSAQ